MNKEINIQFWDGSDENVLKCYGQLLSTVYSREISQAHLKWKHFDNPCGKSVIAYIENEQGEMVAARALWCMFSENAPLFQPCDTVTHPSYQGRGLFTRLTLACLDKIPSNASIMNFPNNNSLPGYLKLGWKVLEKNKKVFNFSVGFKHIKVNDLQREIGDKVSQTKLDFLVWRFNQPHYTFELTNTHLIVSNGQQSGGISLDEKHQGFAKSQGRTFGYVLPSKHAHLTQIFKGSWAFKCNSRTVYFLKEQANFDAIEQSTRNSQINLLMDTF